MHFVQMNTKAFKTFCSCALMLNKTIRNHINHPTRPLTPRTKYLNPPPMNSKPLLLFPNGIV